MPDGLQLYALDGGKLEIMQEIITASADGTIDEDDLGNCFLKLYCSTYSELRDLELEDIADLGRQIAREATLEDRQAAEEVIVDDFNALSASMTSSPKGGAIPFQHAAYIRAGLQLGYSRDELETVSAIELIQVAFADAYANKSEDTCFQWQHADSAEIDAAKRNLKEMSSSEWLTDDFLLNQ